MAPNQREDSCVVQHAGLIRETVKSQKSYWVQTQDVSVRCQQQSRAARKQKARVVWGIGRSGLQVTGLGVMLNSTRNLTAKVKRGLRTHRESSSLHAGDTAHAKVSHGKMSLWPLHGHDLIERGDLWWMRTKEHVKGRGMTGFIVYCPAGLLRFHRTMSESRPALIFLNEEQ